MIGYRGPGLALECDDFAVSDDTRYRHQCVAVHTVEVIVMCGDQLQSGSSVVEDELANHAAGNELFGRTKHRRKVALQPSARETVVQFVKRPGVAVAVTQNSQDRIRDAGFAGHEP